MAWSQALIIIYLCVFAGAQLAFKGETCGQIICKIDQYCSEYDNQCSPCSTVCSRENHNFAEKLCVDKCQEYLHDIRYVKIGNQQLGSNTGNQEGDILKLYRLVEATLTLVILVIISLSSYGFYKLYRWAKANDFKLKNVARHFKRGQENSNDNVKTNKSAPMNGGPRTDLRLNIATPMSNSDITTPGTLSTGISRRPAEDSVLDYAYDNHAMSGTPSPHSDKAARQSDY